MVDQHVIPMADGWGVRATTSRQPSEIFDTLEDAIKHARSLAEDQNSSLFIRDVDGTLTKEADYHTRENPVEIQSVRIGNEYIPRLDE